VDFVETDPRPTADGVLVNIHDDTVDRVTTGTGAVDEMTYDEIVALQLETDAFPGDYSCEHIATLEEILSAAKGRVHVLVDANKTDRVDLLVNAILSTDTLEEAIFDTSSPDKIDAALAIEPSLHTMIRVASTTELSDQIAHFADHPPVIVEIDANTPELATPVREAGHRPFTDVFITDAQVSATGNVDSYGPFYENGLAILESDRPELIVEWLNR
jgi:glycerophosphoryl diester phosphodiesterase